jgi:hypothetical protein
MSGGVFYSSFLQFLPTRRRNDRFHVTSRDEKYPEGTTMNTVIQKLSLLTYFFFTLFSYYASMVWTRCRIGGIPFQGLRPTGIQSQPPATIFFTAVSSEKDQPVGSGASRRSPGSPARTKFSVAGDWLAPALIWLLVISMGLAIAGFLLGEK